MRGLQPKTVVRTIWQGARDKEGHLIHLRLDGAGTCFTTIRETLFFAINARPNLSHLLKINLLTHESSVIYQVSGSITGITHWGTQKLLLIASQELSDYLLTISTEGRLLQQVAIGERREGRRAIRVYAAPPYWMRMPEPETLLVYSYGGDGDMLAFSLQGHLKRKWQGIKGVAFDSEKRRLYVSGAVVDSDLPLAKPPREMKSPAWRLVGVDRDRHFYWYRSTIGRSWLACTDSRRIRWIVPLGGVGGVLETHYRSLSFGLGWGGDMLEVFPDGRIWLSATQPATGEAPALVPGVYELRVLDN